MGRDCTSAVWYELPFLSSAGCDSKKSGGHARTLLVSTTRHLLEAVILKFAGMLANNLSEGAGRGLQVVASIADVSHHLLVWVRATPLRAAPRPTGQRVSEHGDKSYMNWHTNETCSLKPRTSQRTLSLLSRPHCWPPGFVLETRQ